LEAPHQNLHLAAKKLTYLFGEALACIVHKSQAIREQCRLAKLVSIPLRRASRSVG
jgi:hypothetical protein